VYKASIEGENATVEIYLKKKEIIFGNDKA
jgi:hypothetical protein